VELEAAQGNIYSLAVKNSGVVEATGTEQRDGVVYLTGGGNDIEHSGIVRAENLDGSGGAIYVGDTAQAGAVDPVFEGVITNTGVIDASGKLVMARTDCRESSSAVPIVRSTTMCSPRTSLMARPGWGGW